MGKAGMVPFYLGQIFLVSPKLSCRPEFSSEWGFSDWDFYEVLVHRMNFNQGRQGNSWTFFKAVQAHNVARKCNVKDSIFLFSTIAISLCVYAFSACDSSVNSECFFFVFFSWTLWKPHSSFLTSKFTFNHFSTPVTDLWFGNDWALFILETLVAHAITAEFSQMENWRHMDPGGLTHTKSWTQWMPQSNVLGLSCLTAVIQRCLSDSDDFGFLCQLTISAADPSLLQHHRAIRIGTSATETAFLK